MLSPTCCKAGIASKPKLQQDDRLAPRSQIKSGNKGGPNQPRARYHWNPPVWLTVGKPDHDYRAVPIHYGFLLEWISVALVSSVLQIRCTKSLNESRNETIRNCPSSCDVGSQCLMQQGSLLGFGVKTLPDCMQSHWCFRLVDRASR